MLKKIQKGIRDVKGTASELGENRAYDDLVDLVGESGAQHAIQRKLQDRGLTLDEWGTYRKVRTVMHTNPLGISDSLEEAHKLAEGCLET